MKIVCLQEVIMLFGIFILVSKDQFDIIPLCKIYFIDEGYSRLLEVIRQRNIVGVKARMQHFFLHLKFSKVYKFDTKFKKNAC